MFDWNSLDFSVYCFRFTYVPIVVQNHSPSTNSEISENLFILDNIKNKLPTANL
jgi:hypothetical protein